MKTAIAAITGRFRPAYRTLFLALIGTIGIIYGAGIITASDANPAAIHWWPGSVARLGGLPTLTWGIIWCCTGSFMLGSLWSLPRRDRIQFTAAAALNGIWSALAIQAAGLSHEPGAWAPAAIYAGIAVAILLISAWPEPARTHADGAAIITRAQAAADRDD